MPTEIVGLEEGIEETHLMGIIHSFGGLVYTPTRHELLGESQFLSRVKRMAQDTGSKVADLLFMYRHRLRKTFVLAYWIPGVEPVKAMVEIECWNFHPDRPGKRDVPPTAEAIRRMLLPRAAKMREIAQASRDARDRLIMERRVQNDRHAAHVRKAELAGMESEAAIAHTGITPYYHPDDKGELEALTERLLSRKR